MADTNVFDRLDADQRAAVTLRNNGTVSAGAGSGKTTVLAARYLDLVFRDGADVRSILCLTYTRKAAAEMRARVYRELLSSGSDQGRAQIDRFAEASISTIDAFCGTILRSSAQEYGYTPDFAVDDERTRNLAESESLRFILGRREEAPLRELFARMGFERAWKELFAEVAYRFAWPAERPEADFGAMPARAKAALEAAVATSLAELDEARRLGLGAGAVHTARGKAAMELLAGLPPEPAGLSLDEAVRATASLAAFPLTNFGRSEAESLLKTATQAAREAARNLSALAVAESLAPLEEAILGLLGEFAELYREAKRRAGLMSFRDVEVAAVDLLVRRPELRAYWKRRYRYIMVDEFQDDDELQKELLYLLAERGDRMSPGIPAPEALAPDKLFFVGDDKQSIYRFRGADVSVFNRLGRELETGTTGDPGPRLRKNYRSEPALVAFFNELFSRVLSAEGEAEDFEARFEETLPRAPSPGIEPSIRLLWEPRSLPESAEELRSPDEALAEGLVARLKRDIEERRLMVPGATGPRPAVYDDVAVLLRSTSKQYLLERFLRLHGIPYEAASVRGLFVESPANDLYALLRLVLLPEDRVAYAAVLRSPLVSLSDDGLVTVLAGETEAFSAAAEPGLSAEDLRRYRRGREIFEDVGTRADRIGLAELVSYIWYEGGLRHSILRRPDAHPYLEHYDYLFALAVRSDAAGDGLSSFVSRLEPLMGRPEKLEDLEAPREAGRGVKLMSVHKSKGLEFPVVVIPWLETQGRRDGPGDAFYLSEEAGLTLNLRAYDEPGAKKTNVFYETARSLEERKNHAEIKRLFYVATTRASSHLIFAAIEPSRTGTEGSSFLSLLAGGAGRRNPEGSFAALPPAVSVEELPVLPEAAYRRLAGSRKRQSLEPFVASMEKASIIDRRYPPRVLSATSLAEAAWTRDPRRLQTPRGLPPSAFDLVGGLPERVFGELCHATLEARLGGSSLRLSAELLALLPEDSRAALIAEAERLAELFMDSSLGRRIRQAPRVETEKTIYLALRPYTIQCRLDLLAEDEEGFLIVDWKSGKEIREGEYELQLALYRRAVNALARGKSVSSFLFWLRSGEAEAILAAPSNRELLELAQSVAAASLGDDVEGNETKESS